MRPLPLCAWLLLQTATSSVYAGDPLGFVAADGTHEAALRWDNIERAPVWVSGVAPRYIRATGVHTVTLVAGESTQVHLPRHATLRVRGDAHGALQVEVTRGSGLFVALTPYAGNARDALYRPNDAGPHHVRIALRDDAKDEATVALFVSRTVRPAAPDTTRSIAPRAPAPSAVSLRLRGTSATTKYYQATPERPFAVALEGPATYAVEARARVNSAATGASEYLAVAVDGNALEWLAIGTDPERREVLFIDGAASLRARLERYSVNIPAGHHELTLTPASPMLLRVLARDDARLLTTLNPLPPHNPQWRAQLTSRLLTDDARAQLRAHGVADDVIALAASAALDNHRSDGGLLAAELLKTAAAEPGAPPALVTYAGRMQERHTFRRDLHPSTATTEVGATTIVAPTVAEFEAEKSVFVLDGDRFADEAARMANGWFYRLHGGDTVVYDLPPRDHNSELDIMTLAEDGASAASFELTFDDGPPRPMRFEPDYRLAPERKAVDLSSALVSLAGFEEFVGQPAARRIRAARRGGSASIALPAAVRRITVRRPLEAPSLALALDYRAARVYELSDRDALALRQRHPDGAALLTLFLAALARIDNLIDGDPSERTNPDAATPFTDLERRQLLNHWVPLLRRLNARRAQFRANLAPLPSATSASTPIAFESAAITAALAAAMRAAAAGEWLNVLERVTPLVRHHADPARGAALALGGDALAKLGETYLAEQWWRSVVVFDASAAIRAQGFARLFEMYAAQRRWQRLEQLHIERLITAPGVAHARALFAHWYEHGEFADALMLGMIVPHIPVAKLAYAAYADSRYELAAALLAQLDPGTAPADLANALAAMRAGRLPAASIALSAWFADGPTAWRSLRDQVTAQGGTATLTVSGREAPLERVRARADAPLTLSVSGPLRLRFDLRLVHDSKAILPRDAWIRIDDGQRSWIAPISGDRPAAGITWNGQRLPGRRARFELSLDAGTHSLRLAPERGEVLVAVAAERSIFAPDRDERGGASPRVESASLSSATTNEFTCAAIAHSRLFECGRGIRATAAAAGAAATLLPLGAPAAAALPPLETFTPLDAQIQTRNPHHLMVRLLREWDLAGTAPAERARILSEVAALAGRYPAKRALQVLAQRVTAAGEWQLVDAVAASAGVRLVTRPPGEIESAELRVRAALLPKSCRDGYLVASSRDLTYAVFNLRARRIGLEIMRCEPAFLPQQPMALELEQGRQRETVLVAAQDAGAEREMVLPAGEQTLRVSLHDAAVNQYLVVRIHDERAAPARSERLYHVSRRDQPLRLDIAGPAWLRVGELRDEGNTLRYMALAPGWQSVDLPPAADGEESLYRIHRLVLREAAGEPRPRDDDYRPPALPAPLFTASALRALQTSLPVDGLPLGGQEDGTPSFGLRVVSRTRVDDEQGVAGTRLRENFLEWQLHHRRYQPIGARYVHAQALLRVREAGAPSFGGALDARAQPFARWPDVGARVRIDAMAQAPGAALSARSGGLEWRAAALGELFVRHDLGERLFHVPRLSVFGSALSLERNDTYAGERLDRDVFSRYKAQHQHGVRLGDTLTFRAFLDSEGFLRGRVSSNENFNLARPDNAELRAGWRQLVGPLDLELSYLHRRFFRDDQRGRAADQRELAFGLNWLTWRAGPALLEARFDLTRSFTADDNSFFLTLLWHGGRGRGSRDFRSSELRFKDLRRGEYEHDLNRIDAEPHAHLP